MSAETYVVGSGPSGPKWRSQVTAMLLRATAKTYFIGNEESTW